MRDWAGWLIPLGTIAATRAVGRVLDRRTALARLEQRLFDAARRLHSERRLALFGDLSALGSSTVVALVAAGGAALLALLARPSDAVLLATVPLAAGFSGSWLKRATQRARPEGGTTVTFGSSFPSSHTVMASALWPLAAMLAGDGAGTAVRTWLAAVGMAIPAAVGLSRVFLHVHFLSDVVAGWAVGAAWTLGALAARAG